MKISLLVQFKRLVTVMLLIAVPGSARAIEDKEVDDAIVSALRFLVRQQRANGCWIVDGVNESTAMTSLAVMSFLAAGHVPGEGPYGQVIDRGVNYVLDHQHPNGMLVDSHGTGPMYDHGISTLMLSEVVGMMPKDQAAKTRKVLEKAVRLILDAQRANKNGRDFGGWRYQVTSTDSDLSVTGWQLLALRAVKDVGCDVPAENIERAVGYVKRCFQQRGFGYQPNHQPTSTITAAGVLALQLCDRHNDPAVTSGIEFLNRQPLRYDDGWFFYGAYYNAICAYKYGGPEWEKTKAHLFRELLANQQPLGNWQARSGNERPHGDNYSTTLAVLALTVEYGYLPIYQR